MNKLARVSLILAAWGVFILNPQSSLAGQKFAESSQRSKASKENHPAKKLGFRKPNSPEGHVASRVSRMIQLLSSRPIRPIRIYAPPEVKPGWSKKEWLEASFDSGVFESSWATQMLSDKLLFFKLVQRELGSHAVSYFPKTVGLRDFLVRHQLVGGLGHIKPDWDLIDEALHSEFPNGFVVRPAVGVAPLETGNGLFASQDEFITELTRSGSKIYSADHALRPVRSSILETVASGEAVVLQDHFVERVALGKALAHKSFKEVRIHSFEYEVLPDARPRRWYHKVRLEDSDYQGAEAFVQSFLKDLERVSPHLLRRVPLSFDVARLSTGDMQIIEVIASQSPKGSWSSYLDQPRVLGAYSRHFEKVGLVKYRGVSGMALRYNFANYLPYWELKRERSPAGLAKILAFFPPFP